MTVDSIEGRFRPITTPDKARATKRLFLAAVALVTLAATMHAAWMLGWWLGELLLELS